MSVTKIAQKGKKAANGAPSQLGQSSRKGKRAWRKNVDIGEVEHGLEELREEERITGSAFHKKLDSELFQIDKTGDEQLWKRHKHSRSQLTATKILAQRSAVPPVFSRTQTIPSNTKNKIPRKEKERLLMIAKRRRKGPFNSTMDSSEFPSGSTVELSKAVKESGKYDPWTGDGEENNDVEMGDGFEPPKKQKVKPPILPHPRNEIELSAIPDPHQGTSYNPTAAAHRELLLQAHEEEEKRVKQAESLAAVKQKMESALRFDIEAIKPGVPIGMTVDMGEAPSDDNENENNIANAKKATRRKTTAQRNKAARLLTEKRTLAEKAAHKKLLASVDSVKSFRKDTDKVLLSREQASAHRLLERKLKRKLGLAGTKLGKHKVPTGNVDVQLGDELSESLRELKPEGNLFRDRFQSLQQRAQTEPRVPVIPKSKGKNYKVYEKHAWKRFE